MALVTAFLTYLGKFILFLCIAAGGFYCGKRVRDKKNAKNGQTQS